MKQIKWIILSAMVLVCCQTVATLSTFVTVKTLVSKDSNENVGVPSNQEALEAVISRSSPSLTEKPAAAK